MTRNWPALIFCLIVLSCVLFACRSPDTFVISQDGMFTVQECKNRGLQDQVIMFESRYCGHCQQTKPDFLAAAEEYGRSVVVLDLAEPAQRAKLDEWKISIQYTPTFMIDCKYYVGGQSRITYELWFAGQSI